MPSAIGELTELYYYRFKKNRTSRRYLASAAARSIDTVANHANFRFRKTIYWRFSFSDKLHNSNGNRLNLNDAHTITLHSRTYKLMEFRSSFSDHFSLEQKNLI